MIEITDVWVTLQGEVDWKRLSSGMSLPVGKFYLVAVGYRTDVYYNNVQVEVMQRSPDGMTIALAYHSGDTLGRMWGGEHRTVFGTLSTTIPGSHILRVKPYADDLEGLPLAITFSVAGAAELTAKINLIWYWWKDMPGWKQLTDPVSIPPGAELYLGVNLTNTSAEAIPIHVDTWLTKPDGKYVYLPATEKQDKIWDAQKGGTVSIKPIVLVDAGGYRLRVTLSSGGKTLDDWDVPLGTVEGVVKPPVDGVPVDGKVFLLSVMSPRHDASHWWALYRRIGEVAYEPKEWLSLDTGLVFPTRGEGVLTIYLIVGGTAIRVMHGTFTPTGGASYIWDDNKGILAEGDNPGVVNWVSLVPPAVKVPIFPILAGLGVLAGGIVLIEKGKRR